MPVQDNFIERKIEEFINEFCDEDGHIILSEISSYSDGCGYVKNFIRQALEEQAKEILDCLPVTVVDFRDFKSDEEKYYWVGACEYKDQFIQNLRDKKLIK